MTDTAKIESTPSLKGLVRLMRAYHQPFQSDMQNDHFVLAQEGVTWWGAFRQCLREVSSRLEAMRVEYIEINKAVAEAAGKKNNADKQSDNPKNATAAIRSANIKFESSLAMLRRSSMQERMRDREREMSHLVSRLFALWDRCVEEYDDDFDPRVLDLATWNRKLHRRALAEKACHGQVSAGLLESILALPHPMMEIILTDVGRIDATQALDALKNMPLVDVAALPIPKVLPVDQVQDFCAGNPVTMLEDKSESEND